MPGNAPNRDELRRGLTRPCRKKTLIFFKFVCRDAAGCTVLTKTGDMVRRNLFVGLGLLCACVTGRKQQFVSLHAPQAMRAVNTCYVFLAVAGISIPPVIAFLSPLPHAPGCEAPAFSGAPRVKTSLRVASDNPPLADLPLSPRDETFNPLATLRELLAAPDVVEDAGRYDRFASSGGTWRSRIIGFIPATVRPSSCSNTSNHGF